VDGVHSMHERGNTYKNSVGKSERRRHLKGPRLSASIILKWEGVDWIHLARERGSAYLTYGFHLLIESLLASPKDCAACS
jgi:hypothetical protein